ncbi:peptidoglycan DD-metalloendopeptidase family protein [candidate division KSB1 bacterium]|nr:peptidoglycan DD-metalloendopeptidase family protein [candidate division KSB1 bacterium]
MYFRFYLLAIILSINLIISCNESSYSDKEIDAPENDTMVAKIIEPPAVVKKGTLKYGETLSSVLHKHHFDSRLVHEIVQHFREVYDVRRMRAHDEYTVETDSSGAFRKFSYKPSLESEYIVERNAEGELKAIAREINLVRKIKSLKGTIKTTLYEAILELGETPELLVAISDIFQWDIDFFIDPRVNDRFKIVYEAFYLPADTNATPPQPQQFVRYGKVRAAQYTLQGEELTAVYFDNSPKDDGYYTPTGESFQKTFLKSPLNYRRISSYFSYARKHPILKIVRPHYGIDFAAPTGTPVSAAADGIIIKKGYNRGIGRYIKIRHKNPRYVTLYGHLSRFAKGINEGTQVKQKDVIGYVGSTGLATGPHLHYTFYENGSPINPLKIKNTSGDPIIEENQQKFKRVLNQMLTYLDELDGIRLPLVLNQAQYNHFNRYCISEP